jgi:hypothetical protein
MERINNKYKRDMKTAVEWLIEQWPILESQIPERILEQAKEMEKEQIQSAYRKGHTESSWGRHSNSENYYNETFKSE